jgi:hypothetical protein
MALGICLRLRALRVSCRPLWVRLQACVLWKCFLLVSESLQSHRGLPDGLQRTTCAVSPPAACRFQSAR